MNRLQATAWTLFALDFVVLAMIVREVLVGEVGCGERCDAEQALATTASLVAAAWLLMIGLILIVSGRRASRAGLWIALVGAALPLLWAWSMAVQALTEWFQTPSPG